VPPPATGDGPGQLQQEQGQGVVLGVPVDCGPARAASAEQVAVALALRGMVPDDMAQWAVVAAERASRAGQHRGMVVSEGPTQQGM